MPLRLLRRSARLHFASERSVSGSHPQLKKVEVHKALKCTEPPVNFRPEN